MELLLQGDTSQRIPSVLRPKCGKKRVGVRKLEVVYEKSDGSVVNSGRR